MKRKPFKFSIQITLLEYNDNDDPTGEIVSEPIVLYGVETLKQWVNDLPKLLAAAEKGESKPARSKDSN